MKRPVEAGYSSHVAYTRALEAYCDCLEKPKPLTDLALLDLIPESIPPQYDGALLEFARRIEHVHGITSD